MSQSNDRYEISLLYKYESGLFHGDYSNGIFLDGVCYADSLTEANQIINKFLTIGEIDLYEPIKRYDSDEKLSGTITTIKFNDPDQTKNLWQKEYKRKKHVFGEGYVSYDSRVGYALYSSNKINYHWLKISKI